MQRVPEVNPTWRLRLDEILLERAVGKWTASAVSSEGPAARAAAWAIGDLTTQLTQSGEHLQVVELLLQASRLPFSTVEKRTYLRQAAAVCSDQVGDQERAVALYQELIIEEPADPISALCVAPLASLLERSERAAELVQLWEGQAVVRQSAQDYSGAATLYARAAELSETRLCDTERSLANYTRAADLGLESALEALARLYDSQKKYELSALTLERYCAIANRDNLGERSLWLAQAYVNNGRPDLARACLEHASANAHEVGSIRERLAALYEEAKLWLPLAELLTLEAQRAVQVKTKFQLLVRAAHVHRDQRSNANDAIPLFEQAVELDADNFELRLELAGTHSRAGRHGDASRVLQEQIGRYGARRPKERAMVHYALSREQLALENKQAALEELRAASRIDPTRAEILSLSAKLSMDLGDLDSAEKTFRALLLVLGRASTSPELSRVEALLDLSEIALRRNDSIRSSEYVESAFEIAQDTAQETRALEQIARARGRDDWLSRVLEERLARASNPPVAAQALLDVTRMHAETLNDLAKVSGQLTMQARRIHDKLTQSLAPDESAWSALSLVYEYLGDEEAQATILEARVHAWLEGKVPVDDPKPVLRMGALRLKLDATRREGLKLLALAHDTGATSQDLEDILLPLLESDASWQEPIDLLERAARIDSNLALLARTLWRRLAMPNATVSQYLETLELLRSLHDGGLLCKLLEAAAAGALNLALDDAKLASARLELADIAFSDGNIEKALLLHEDAADVLTGQERQAVLLRAANLAASGEPIQYPEHAIRMFRKLLSDNPSERRYWEPLLGLLRAAGDSKQLVEVIGRTVGSVTDQADRSRLRLEQARLLIDSGDRDGAAQELRALIAEDTAQTEATIMLVDILEKQGKHDELVQMLRAQFDGALQADDTNACVRLLSRIAAVNEQLGRLPEALTALERALNFQGANRDVLERIVELSEHVGESDRAVAALQMLQDAETDPSTRLVLLEKLFALHNGLGDETAAFHVAQDGFNCAPADPIWRTRLFTRLESRGDLVGLAEALNRASLSAPTDLALTTKLVEVNRQLGNYEQALEVLDGVMASGIESLSLSCERGKLLLELGRFEEALTELELADDATPASAEVLLSAIGAALNNADAERMRELGVRQVDLLKRLSRDEESYRVLSELHEQFPQDTTVLQLWAKWLSAHGSPQEALDASEELVLTVDDSQVRQTIDGFLSLCDAASESPRALAALERAVPLLPERTDLRQKLIEVYKHVGESRKLGKMLLVQAEFESDPTAKHGLLLQGAELLLLEPSEDTSAARSALEHARELVPDSLELVILLARLYATEGNTEAAIELLQSTAQTHRGRRSKMLANLYREWSRISLEQGLRGEALDSLLRAFEMDSRNGQLAMQTGRLAMDVENYDVAVRVFARVAMMKPVDDDATGECISHLDRADANYCLAYLSYNQGDARKAKILALKALSDNADHQEARELIEQLG